MERKKRKRNGKMQRQKGKKDGTDRNEKSQRQKTKKDGKKKRKRKSQ